MTRTDDLQGPFLDYFVALADGLRVELRVRWSSDRIPTLYPYIFIVQDAGTKFEKVTPRMYFACKDWDCAGPIIEREKINVGNYNMTNASRENADSDPKLAWRAYPFGSGNSRDDSYGPTPLIAAMRAFVKLKFGDEVPPITG